MSFPLGALLCVCPTSAERPEGDRFAKRVINSETVGTAASPRHQCARPPVMDTNGLYLLRRQRNAINGQRARAAFDYLREMVTRRPNVAGHFLIFALTDIVLDIVGRHTLYNVVYFLARSCDHCVFGNERRYISARVRARERCADLSAVAGQWSALAPAGATCVLARSPRRPEGTSP